MKKTKSTKSKTKCCLKMIRLICLGKHEQVGGGWDIRENFPYTKLAQSRISATLKSLEALAGQAKTSAWDLKMGLDLVSFFFFNSLKSIERMRMKEGKPDQELLYFCFLKHKQDKWRDSSEEFDYLKVAAIQSLKQFKKNIPGHFPSAQILTRHQENEKP